MAGEALTTHFNLSEATVMVGPMAEVFDLLPATHSIGLVKQVAVTNTPTDTDLTQGVQNDIVFSVRTGMDTSISMEVYEYTAKNTAYALGLDASNYDNYDADLLDAPVVGDGATTDSIIIAASSDISANYPAGEWVIVQANTTYEVDKVFLSKIESVSYDAGYQQLTITLVDCLPVGFNFSIGDNVIRQNMVAVGSMEPNAFYGVKIVGQLPNGKPMTFICPKIKITEGFNVAFLTGDFSNMPFVMKSYKQLPADPLYTDYGRLGAMFEFTG